MLEARREAFSPQKTSTRLKRFSSINVEPNYLAPQPQVLMNRSRIDPADYRPLGSAENRAEPRDYSDIDKRIEEIRKKYQEYAPVGASKYGSYAGEENVLRGRTGSSYADYRNAREYGQFGYERREAVGQIQPNRVKRLTSYQEY